MIKMYRDCMDQATRNDIAAAAAAHQELGRDYDDAVAESLIERIGAEIDRRVDARLSGGSRGSSMPARTSHASSRQTWWVGAGVGAGLTGIVAMLVNVHGGKPVAAAVVAVWVILAIAALGTGLVRKYRDAVHGLQPRAVDAPRSSVPRGD
jgi:VIT1/CCC1 family predicted Fe2+/Mn2+ transporter